MIFFPEIFFFDYKEDTKSTELIYKDDQQVEHLIVTLENVDLQPVSGAIDHGVILQQYHAADLAGMAQPHLYQHVILMSLYSRIIVINFEINLNKTLTTERHF